MTQKGRGPELGPRPSQAPGKRLDQRMRYAPANGPKQIASNRLERVNSPARCDVHTDPPELGERFTSSQENSGHHRWKVERKSTRLNSSHVKTSYAIFC